jgi:hypothetical protein
MEWLAAIGVHLAIQIFVGLDARIVGTTELSGFFIGIRVAGLRPVAALGMLCTHGSPIPTN